MKKFFNSIVRTNNEFFDKQDKTKYDDSIVFIEDIQQIYTNGIYYYDNTNIERVEFYENSIELEPNKFYYCNELLDSLDISLSENNNFTNTYFIEFLCDNTQVSLLSNIKWNNNIIPAFTKQYYKVTIKIQDDTAYLENFILDKSLIPDYVVFTAINDSVIWLNKLSTNQILEYSFNSIDWFNMNTSIIINLNANNKVYLRGILSADNTSSNYTQFKMTGKVAASGNINSIWNYRDLNAPLKKYCGYYMFEGCTSLTTAPELPALDISNDCYNNMFSGCTSLTTAPELPATILKHYCYNSMFKNCKSLKNSPILRAELLVDSCFRYMFYNCTNLNSLTCLAIDMSANNCTINWVLNTSPTGTFYKHPNATWTTGVNGIPSGWEIVDVM